MYTITIRPFESLCVGRKMLIHSVLRHTEKDKYQMISLKYGV